MRDGDIFRWSYNPSFLKTLNHGNNGGTTYWCCSQTGMWNEERKVLIDTYWRDSSGRKFTEDDIKKKLCVRFVANINDLEPVNHPGEFNNYDSDDCINISHANMMRGGYYIKKNAAQCVEKKRLVLESYIAQHESDCAYHKRNADRLRKELETLTNETHAPLCY